MNFKNYFVASCLILFAAVNAQSILPGQKSAIKSLANTSGFTSLHSSINFSLSEHNETLLLFNKL